MAKDKTYNKVQLDVKFTQASTRANLTSEENISVAFGKMSKWYADLKSIAWNGHPTYTSKTSGLYKITVDGTGHVSATAAVTASDLPSHTHNNYLGAAKIGSYWGMTYPDGTATGVSWVRTTRNGIIPYAANTDTTDGNVSSLGTSTWTFANGYINNLYYKDLKNVTVVAGNTADNGIDKMTGSFFFSGDNLIGGINDWVGIQAGSSVDKWQIVGSGTRLLYRQNDTGGTDSADWTSWNGLVTPDSIVGNSGISITKLTNNYGSGDDAYSVDVGVYIGHTNSVTAQTDYNKPYVKYDTEGHITESSHFVHLATGTGGVAGWVKLATMKHIKTYDNTPIELTMSQRGNHLTYRLHILFKSVNGLDPDIDKFVISMDTTDDTAIRAYIIKSATSTWDLYILKRDSYEAIAVSEFNVGKYFPDHMEWTWQDEQTDASVITGGTEATKHCYGLFLQSNTTTGNYRPIIMGTTATNDTTKLNATITGQGFVSNSLFVKPSDGYLYANVLSTTSYLNDTGAQLAQYGLYAKSYKEAALPAGGDYSYSGYVIRVHDGKAADNAGMLLTIGSGGLTMVGGGESATNLSTLISDDQRDSNASRTRLNVGGTLNTAFQGSNEQLILSSDYDIYFLTNCNTIANRKPVVLNSSSQFYPGTTLTGSIGTSSYYWNDAYFNNLYLSNKSILAKASGGVYYRAERTDTGTAVSLGVGDGGVNHGIFSHTFNGWLVYGDDSKVYIRSTLYNPTNVTDYFAIPFFGATPSTGAKAIYNNNGLRYSTREGTTSQPGIARLIIGNGVASTSDANKEGTIRIYSVENGFVDLLAEDSTEANTLKFPALTGTLQIQRNALQYDNSSDFASYSWHKFAEVTINAANDDRHITFLVSRTYRRNVIGILTAHIRTTGTKTFDSAQFEWSMANEGIEPSNFVMVYTDTANTSCKVELWYKQEARYDGWIFEVLKEHRREFVDHGGWTLYSSSGHGSATHTTGTGTIVSKLGYIQNAPGIYHVIGTQTSSTSVWTGKIDISELYDGLTIVYYLPYASTSTSVTLNLTLADGTTTGAVNCYYNNTSRLTSQYGAGSTIILTYWSAGSIKVSGTATTDNRWSRCDYNANSSVTQNFASADINRPLLISYYGVGNTTTSAQIAYRNDKIYANTSEGAIHATVFYENESTLSSKYSLNNQIYALNATSDSATFNGAETLITSLPSSSGTGTPSYQRVTVSKFASVMSEIRTPLLYDNSASTTGTNNIIVNGSASDYTSFTITLGLNDMVNRYTVTIPSGIGVYNFPLIWGGAPTSTGGACHITSAFVQISTATGGLRLIVNKNSLVATMNSDGFSIASNSLALYFVTVVGHKK